MRKVDVPKVRSIEKDTKVYAKYQVVKHSEIILFFYLHITLLSGSRQHQILLKKIADM